MRGGVIKFLIFPNSKKSKLSWVGVVGLAENKVRWVIRIITTRLTFRWNIRWANKWTVIQWTVELTIRMNNKWTNRWTIK